MNFYPQLKENIWVGAGSAIGLTLGMGANVLRSRSLFGKNFSACVNPFNGFTPLVAINDIRQKATLSTNLFNPYLPLIHTIPMFASSLWSTFNPSTSQKDKSLLSRGWQNLSNQVINPLIHQNALLGGSLVARSLLSSNSVNPSAHVILHATNTLNAIKSLEGLSNTEALTQKKIYSLLNIGITLTDAVCLYNSAANCHSVAEIASGISCVAMGFIGLELAKGLVNNGCKLIQNRIFSVKTQETSHGSESLQENLDKSESEKIISEPIKVISPSTSSKMEQLWPMAGSLIGLTLGGISNLANTASFFRKDETSCKHPFGGFAPLIEINNFREDELGKIKHNISLSLVNPFCPLVYLVPLFACAVWNTATQKSSEKGLKNALKRGWQHLSKTVVNPNIYSLIVTIGGFGARRFVFNHFNRQLLDTSGHVIHQIAQNLYAIKALQGLEETCTPLQKKAFVTIHTAVAITDAIWMFNTTANCHSVADVIAGLACCAIACGGIGAYQSLLNRTNRISHIRENDKDKPL